MLLKLPEDTKLCILAYLDVPSILNLASTCHELKALTSQRTVWLDALESMRLTRPIPLAYWEQSSRSASAAVPLERLREAVIRAAKIERNCSRHVIKPTRYLHRTPLLAEGDALEWVWNIGSCDIDVAYTARGSCTCTFGTTGQSITFQTRHLAVCYDFDIDCDGITLVFNSSGSIMYSNMEVYRIDFQSHTPKLVKDVPTGPGVSGNFLEDELAGCIRTVNGSNYVMIIINWRTGKVAIIDTGIPQQDPDDITASTTKEEVLVAYENRGVVQTWIYGLDSLRLCVANAQGPETPYQTFLAPQESREVMYEYDLYNCPPMTDRNDYVHYNSRGMFWAGQQSCFTKYSSGAVGKATFFTYTLVPDERHTGLQISALVGQTDALSLKTNGTRESRYLSRHAFIYKFPADIRMSVGAGEFFLYEVGTQGKAVVWVESGKSYTCRLATFSHADDSKDITVSGKVSILDWAPDGFSWTQVRYIHLDDSAGVLTIYTNHEYWILYFD